MIRKSLLATFDFPPVRGGISSFMLNIAQTLPPDKLIVLTEKKPISPDYRFRVYRKKLVSHSRYVLPHWLPLLWSMYSLVKKEKIFVIQVGQILPFGTCALILKKILHIPYIIYVYGQDLVIMRHSHRKMKQIRSILKNAEAVIGCSHFTKQLAEENGALPQRTHVVYPCPTFHPSQEYNQAEVEDFKISHSISGKKILLTVGNLVLRKGHDMVLKALPEVIKHTPDVVYVITGIGPQLRHLQQEVRLRQLEPYVQFWPQVNHQDLQKLYRSCDVFIMPSRILKNQSGQPVDVEGFGIVFVEASLFGKPAIGGNSGGVSEAIKNGVTGIIIDPEDSSAIAEAIIRLISDGQLAQQLGRQGRARSLEKFDWNNESTILKNILDG
jgi:phosphatidylinositol alpha-1,6-mannosyltransferase